MVKHYAEWSATISKASIGWNIMVKRNGWPVWPYWALTRRGVESKARTAIAREIAKRERRERAINKWLSREKWTINFDE